MKKYNLTVEKRDNLGKQVKTLRKQGIIPATIYSHGLESVSVAVKLDDFNKIYKEAGKSQVIYLGFGTETRPVLVHHLQTHPVTRQILHIEFHQVDLKEKTKATIQIELVNESPAVEEKKGVLLRLLDEVEVEALPTNLPEKIILDITPLTDVDSELKVSDLVVPPDVEILSDQTLVIARIGTLTVKEEEVAPVVAEETEAKPEGEEAGAENAGEAKSADEE